MERVSLIKILAHPGRKNQVSTQKNTPIPAEKQLSAEEKHFRKNNEIHH